MARHLVALSITADFINALLGATVGDLLDKPVEDGRLALSRVTASLVLAGFMVLLILVTPQRAGGHPGSRQLPT